MAKAHAKTKAKKGSKSVKKAAPKKKRSAKATKAKRPAAKKRPAPKKPAKVAKKAAPAKKPAAAKLPVPIAVGRALAQADVEGLINRLPPPVQPVVKTLRKLVLDAAPEASELLDDGAPAYFANGVFARIVPSEREVLVKFLKGAQLPSAGELSAEGELSLTEVSELKENVLRKIVREAVMLNLSQPPSALA